MIQLLFLMNSCYEDNEDNDEMITPPELLWSVIHGNLSLARVNNMAIKT